MKKILEAYEKTILNEARYTPGKNTASELFMFIEEDLKTAKTQYGNEFIKGGAMTTVDNMIKKLNELKQRMKMRS